MSPNTTMSDHPTFLIIGCGAVGIVYTYIISRAVPVRNIIAVCRSNREIAAQRGFKLNSAVWGRDLTVKPVVVGSIDEAVAKNEGKRFDYIIISTKCVPPFSDLPASIRPAVTDANTSIVLFQNGIGIEDAFAAIYPSNPIISVVVYIKATETTKAVVEHNGVERLHMGTFPATAPSFQKLAVLRLEEVLTSGGATVTVHADVQRERWSKALINAAWNPISALTRLGDASFLSADQNVATMVRDVMREVASVARACGYDDIDDGMVEFQLGKGMSREPPGIKYSMLHDTLAGRPMEVDVIAGNIVSIGRRRGVKTPLLSMLHLLAKGLDMSSKQKN